MQACAFARDRMVLTSALLALAGCSGHAGSRAQATDSQTPAQHAPADPPATHTLDTCTGTHPLPAYLSDPKLCAFVFAEHLDAARQMAFAPNGDLFVNNGRITVLWDANHDGASGADERAVFGSAADLNHGLAFDPGHHFVYASSDTAIYRFTYSAGQRHPRGDAQVVIHGMPEGGHSTRTLAFDAQGRLYVNIGSASNLDTNQHEWDTRSQVRRYQLPAKLPSGGLEYASGELLARGMRNEVGLYVDEHAQLWGVENGRDDLRDPDHGGDIHDDNPGEEINLVDGSGSNFYGYPLCYSEYVLPAGSGPGTQWADKTLPAHEQTSDAFCRDASKVHPPLSVMPAHWAPLGIVKYSGHVLPFNGDLIITAHGSWDRQPPTGRIVARAQLSGTQVSHLEVIFGERGRAGQLEQGRWDVRPVDVRQGPDEALYVSDDSGGRVIKLGYRR